MNRLFYLCCLLSFTAIKVNAQSLAWVKHIPANLYFHIKIDPAGNKYLFGVVANGGTYVIQKVDVDSNIIWTRTIDNVNSTTSAAIDHEGNVYIAGTVPSSIGGQATSIDFNPGSGIDTVVIKPDGFAFFASYDSSGNFRWVKVLKSGVPTINSIDVDRQKNILLSGFFSGTVNFDPLAPGGSLNSSNSGGTFISAYDATGKYLWAKNGYNFLIVCRDLLGNIYALTSFGDSMDVEPGTLVNKVYGQELNISVCKYDAMGNFIWSRNIGADKTLSISPFDVFDMDVDYYGNVYIGGGFNNNVDFDPGAGTKILTSKGVVDNYILKLDSSGSFQWVNQISGISFERFYRCIVNKLTSEIFALGSFELTTDFDPGSGTVTRTAVNSTLNGYVAKYNKSGNLQWVGHSPGVTYRDIAIDFNTDHFYAAGDFLDSTDFDPTISGKHMLYLKNIGQGEGYLLKLNQPLSVQTITIDNIKIQAYPNPVISNEVTIDLDKFYNQINLTLSDVSGKLIHTQTITNAKVTSYNVQLLNPGTYFIRVQADGEYATVKFVK